MEERGHELSPKKVLPPEQNNQNVRPLKNPHAVLHCHENTAFDSQEPE